jgi:hypothetical protein
MEGMAGMAGRAGTGRNENHGMRWPLNAWRHGARGL